MVRQRLRLLSARIIFFLVHYQPPDSVLSVQTTLNSLDSELVEASRERKFNGEQLDSNSRTLRWDPVCTYHRANTLHHPSLLFFFRNR